MDTRYPISPATQALIELLALWPRRRIAKHMRRHVDPTSYLLSGALRNDLQQQASAAMHTKSRVTGGLPRSANGPRRAEFVVGILDPAYPDIAEQIPGATQGMPAFQNGVCLTRTLIHQMIR